MSFPAAPCGSWAVSTTIERVHRQWSIVFAWHRQRQRSHFSCYNVSSSQRSLLSCRLLTARSAEGYGLVLQYEQPIVAQLWQRKPSSIKNACGPASCLTLSVWISSLPPHLTSIDQNHLIFAWLINTPDKLHFFHSVIDNYNESGTKKLKIYKKKLYSRWHWQDQGTFTTCQLT